MSEPKFFALIIGTEILNRRRVDKHFDFVTKVLLQKGHKLTGSIIIEDDPELIVQTIKFIASDPDSVLFSFGGIGSTPDDHTRKCAALALREGVLYTHEEAKKIISTALGDRVSRHSYTMAELPKNSDLIENPFNKIPAFSLDNRFYFMPGFPEMSHPMVKTILSKLIQENKTFHRFTLTALCRESELIEVMENMPSGVEFSSLPKLYSDGWRVSISVASSDADLAKKAFTMYTEHLDRHHIIYDFNDE